MIARRILAALLLAMASGQLSDPAGFVDVLEGYGLGGRAAAVVLSATLIVAELVAGVGLWRASTLLRPAAAVSVAVALGWSFLAVQAFARGLVLDNCGCFGVHLAQPLRWWVLLEDAEFVALAMWVWWRVPRAEPASAGTSPARQMAT